MLASNSICKSFISALLGIAIDEGAIQSVDDPLGKYIEEFKGTTLEKISIKHCLQMASGIGFDEDKDMSKMSIRMLLGQPAIKYIAKLKLKDTPGQVRKYASINTEILGELITRATGYGLAEYLEAKIWKHIGTEREAYWTLSNNKELAMGGLNISLRDYARFARLYLNEGCYEEKQIIPKQWVKDTSDISAAYSKPGANDDVYNALGYGYQWWIPKGDEGELMAIGIYSQWIYINPTQHVIIIKTSAHKGFMEENHELKTVEFLRHIANQ